MAENNLLQPLDLRKCFSEEPTPLDFVLPGLLSGTVGALVAAGGSSKSAVAMQAAVAVAGGPDTLKLAEIDNQELKTGRVVYVAAEDPANLLHHRMHALGEFVSPDQREQLAERLEIYPANGLLVNVLNDSWMQWVYGVAENARLVIIDTLRRVHSLDENDSGAMAHLVGFLESVCHKTGTTILYVHHTNKMGATTGDQTATRGSSVLTDNARLQLNLVTMQPDEAKALGVDAECRRNFVRMIYAKTNYCAPYADRWFRRREGGRLEPATFYGAKPKGGNRGQA